MYKELLSKSIKKLRCSHNLTQEAFAEKIGMTIEAVRNMEQNKSTPTAKTIDKICTTFNIKLIELFIEEPTTETQELLRIIQNKLSILTNKKLRHINDIIDTFIKIYK